MGLKLVTGRAHSEAGAWVRQFLQAGAADGRDVVLVLPGFADVRRAREELAESIPVGVDITTFDQWLDSLWRRFGDGRHLVTPILRQAIAGEASAAGMEALGHVTESAGFTQLVSRIAARSAGLARNAGSGSVLTGLETVLDRYEQMLRGSDLVEPGEAARSLAHTETVSGLTVAWYRFTDLSTIQLNFIGALTQSNDVAVSLCWEAGFPATEALDITIQQLSAIANSHVALDARGQSSELYEVEKRLYQPRDPLQTRGSVVLSEAAGPEAEAALVASAARRALDDGFAPERIAVVFKDLARRRGLIEMALCAASVPFAADFQVEFGSTPLGSALLALADITGGSGGRGELLHFLRGPFSDASESMVDELDARLRRFRVTEPSRLISEAAALTHQVSKTLALARRICRSDVAELATEDWQRLTGLMLSIASQEGSRHEGDMRLDIASHGRVIEAAGQMAASGIAFRGDALLRSMADLPISSGTAERPGSIQVTEAHRIRSRHFDVVIIGGLTAAEFSSEKREPLAATLLKKMGLSAGMDERLAERMLFYLVVTQAGSRLELVRQATDSSGNPQRASVFWEEVRDLYRTPAQAAAGEAGGLAVAHSLQLSHLEQAAPAFSEYRMAARRDAARGVIRPPGMSRGRVSGLNGTGRTDDEYSVTEIEQYLACPYRWFYGRAIRPSEVDRFFDARRRGSYAHTILSAFYGVLHERGHERVAADNLVESLQLLDEVIESTAQEPAWRTKGLRESISASLTHSQVRRAIEQDAHLLEGFVPAAHEWAFGRRDGMPFELAGVALRGKVDRVDVGPSGAVVMDYKSSAAVHGHAAFVGKRLLQGVVYARAVEDGFGTKPVAGLYRSLPTGEMRGYWNTDAGDAESFVHAKDLIDTNQLVILTAEVEHEIRRAIEGMQDGRIEQRPADRTACVYCSAKPFCKRAVS